MDPEYLVADFRCRLAYVVDSIDSALDDANVMQSLLVTVDELVELAKGIRRPFTFTGPKRGVIGRCDHTQERRMSRSQAGQCILVHLEDSDEYATYLGEYVSRRYEWRMREVLGRVTRGLLYESKCLQQTMAHVVNSSA